MVFGGQTLFFNGHLSQGVFSQGVFHKVSFTKLKISTQKIRALNEKLKYFFINYIGDKKR